MLRVSYTSKFESLDILSMCLLWRRIFISPAFTSMHSNYNLHKHTIWSWTRCTMWRFIRWRKHFSWYCIGYTQAWIMQTHDTRNLIYFRFVAICLLLLVVVVVFARSSFYQEFRIAFILTSNTVRSNLHTFCELLKGINRRRNKWINQLTANEISNELIVQITNSNGMSLTTPNPIPSKMWAWAHHRA